MPARTEFLHRLEAIDRVIPAELVQNKAFHERGHNESARLLRNGLMVVGVVALEDFIKARTKELLTYLSGAGLSFATLPEHLRRAATLNVVRSASGTLAKVWAALGEDVIANTQTVAMDVASTSAPGFRLSPYTFGYEASNLTSQTVKEILRAFGMRDPWRQMSRIAHRSGLSSPSHEEAFSQAMRNRHAAAHQAAAQTEPTDLAAFIKHAKGIALSFDAIGSRAARNIAGARSGAALPDTVDNAITLRYLDQASDGTWKEVPEGASRAYRRAPLRAPLEHDVFLRAQRTQSVVIVRDVSSTPLDWRVTDIP